METKDFQKSLCPTTPFSSYAPQCYHSFQKNHMGLVSYLQELDLEDEGASQTVQIYEVYHLPQIIHTGLKHKLNK